MRLATGRPGAHLHASDGLHFTTEYFQVLGGTAGPVILKYPDDQPPGLPGQSVQIGLVLACNWRLSIGMVTVDDMPMPVPDIGATGITLPEQRFLILLVEWNSRIDRGVNE